MHPWDTRYQSSIKTLLSINLDRGIDFADKDKAGQETHEPAEHKHCITHDEHIPEIDRRCQQVELCAGVCARKVVEGSIHKHVNRCCATGKHRPPPPPVVLGTQVQVAHDDRNLHARHQQNCKHNREEAEDVVKAVLPDRGENEEHFYKNRSKRQQPA